MHSGSTGSAWRAFLGGLAALLTTAAVCRAAPCPPAGASLQVRLDPAVGAPPASAIVAGVLAAASCDDAADALASTYVHTLTCSPGAPAGCAADFAGLRPGAWTHRVLVIEGEPLGQFQGRIKLLLDAAAGVHLVAWPLYRSVQTVRSLDDAPSCVDCLRAAIAAADIGFKPALIQFAPELSGTIRLTAAPPPLLTSLVTLDAFNSDGIPLTRTIDGNGLDVAALRILGSDNQILGLRAVNVGGDSDVIVIEGPEAIDNVLDTIEVVGRAIAVCGTNGEGCVVDGVCRVPSPQTPQGFCGNDGIAVRALAGLGGANRIRRSTVSGAHDKGVKVSDRGVAVVEDSTIVANADGGLQATLGGQLTARHNAVFANRGTTTANGLAANGAAVGSTLPARLETRGNLSVGNALRGISVRSLSVAELHDDFVCGNSVGMAVQDAAGFSAVASSAGLAVVRNDIGGVNVANNSSAAFGEPGAPGDNAVAFNGRLRPTTPANFRNQTTLPIAAVGNFWEHCGSKTPCDVAAVQALDIFTASLQGPVALAPAHATRQRPAPRITAIDPPFAAAGDLVRIFGSGFDAIEGIGASCAAVATANTCRPLRGNCVFIDRTPAEVVAVTPTMLVVRAPFTCVAPVPVSVRTRWSHGFGRAQFCVVPPP